MKIDSLIDEVGACNQALGMQDWSKGEVTVRASLTDGPSEPVPFSFYAS